MIRQFFKIFNMLKYALNNVCNRVMSGHGSELVQMKARLILGKYICLGERIIIYVCGDMLIYLQSLLLLCCAAILLTLILSLCLISSPLLPSKTA